MQKSDKSYFNAAKAISLFSDHKFHHIGAILVSGHHIISSGYNSASKSHPLQAKIDKKFFKDHKCLGPLHAETMALLPFINNKINLKDCTLYVYRAHKNGTHALARPCQRCMTLLKKMGIRHIKYTIDGIDWNCPYAYTEETIKEIE